jgi:hypothetical protein
MFDNWLNEVNDGSVKFDDHFERLWKLDEDKSLAKLEYHKCDAEIDSVMDCLRKLREDYLTILEQQHKINEAQPSRYDQDAAVKECTLIDCQAECIDRLGQDHSNIAKQLLGLAKYF